MGMVRKYTKPPRDGCGGYKTDSPITGTDYGCNYDPPFNCEDCMYCEGNNGKGKNPQATVWWKESHTPKKSKKK